MSADSAVIIGIIFIIVLIAAGIGGACEGLPGSRRRPKKMEEELDPYVRGKR